MYKFFVACILSITTSLFAEVTPGIEQLFTNPHENLLKGKRIGLITNQTGITRSNQTTIDLLQEKGYHLAALFAPEHGIQGIYTAEQRFGDEKDKTGIPVYSLHGKTLRPTADMLSDIDLIIYDIQDIGSRSYTYVNTLFYVMEEAAKHKIPVIVADRPNPINGLTIDGPMLEEKYRSIVGYINVPYCHGMTTGELANYFNTEYKIGCSLKVIPMKGWKRSDTFAQTHLPWIPTSPHIPEATTALYYPATGILGELQIVSIGVGYTLPFRLVGAPWINSRALASALNKQNLPGIQFSPFSYKPFYGKFSHETCHGILLTVTNPATFRPVTTQYVIMGLLKSLYPKEMNAALRSAKKREEMFNKVNGTDQVLSLLTDKPYVAWELRSLQKKEREAFREKRKKYLIY